MRFNNFKEFVDLFNTSLRDFSNKFVVERKRLNQQKRTATKNRLFSYKSTDGRPWAINEGGGTEIQYQIYIDWDSEIFYYGLGINTQYVPFANDMSMVEYAEPYAQAFLREQKLIREMLPSYEFVIGNATQLAKLEHGKYILFGVKIPISINEDNSFEIDKEKIDIAIMNLQLQFEAYKLVFKKSNEIKQSSSMKEDQQKKLNEIIALLESKKQMILQGAPGTGKTYTAKDIAEQMIFGTTSTNKIEQNKKLKHSEQFKLVQFHPSYTYEDFVRGVVVKTGEGFAEYRTENKILGKFTDKALQNWLDSKKTQDVISKEDWLNKQFEEFVNTVIDTIDLAGDYKVTDNVSIVSVDENAFRYKGHEGWNIKGNRMLFKDIKQAYLDDNIERQNVKHNQNLSGLAHWHASYYVRVLTDFREFLKTNKITYAPAKSSKREALNYILIIDEINRANLPAVLGELIYALEYRGDALEGMYELDEGDNKLILPPNLYIIGTMNTADRSVGHIDYAIRRRFAFVDVLPTDLSSELGEDFKLDLFNKVKELFTEEYLSSEFEAKDVQLGHSYFIQQYKKDKEDKSIKEGPIDFNLRLEYEIKPILREYVRDGILKEVTKDKIEALNI